MGVLSISVLAEVGKTERGGGMMIKKSWDGCTTDK